MPHLPVDDVLPKVAAALQSAGRVVVEAPPGSGKTTCIPTFLADRYTNGDVVVVEPRRLAARLAAQYVAAQRQEAIGLTIGYQVRFESVVGEDTRVRYVTEGVFARQLLADPTLQSVGTVLLDEFHERHLTSDLALAWLVEQQRTQRPDLRIVVMSATLDSAAVARFLDPCPVIQAEGKRFPVDLSYLSHPDDRPLSLQIAGAVRSLAREGLEGDVLVFLPGATEIRQAREACAPVADACNLSLVALHGNLSREEQDRALAPHNRPKVILSTNVAESSVTIDGVVAVVDSGLARVAAHAPWSGLPTLRVTPISKASAAQRAGRAGRTRPGRCLRLYTEADWMRRPDHLPPEIQRMDLTETALMLRGLGADVSTFSWFEPPDPAAWNAANTLLHQLGAVSNDGSLTKIGTEVLRFPVHPRVGRVLVEAQKRGVAKQATVAAAVIGERDLALASRSHLAGPSMHGRQPHSTDLLDAVDRFEEAAQARFEPSALRTMGVDVRAAREVNKVRSQLLSLCRNERPEPTDPQVHVGLSILCGYPDRVARRVRGTEIALAGGGSAKVATDQDAAIPDFLIAIDAEEQRDGRSRRLMVRRTCKIEPEWLLDLFPDDIGESEEHRWNASQGCVESVERLTYRGLVLDETKGRHVSSSAVAEVLFAEARSLGVHAFAPKGELEAWLCRVKFLHDNCPEAGFPHVDVSTAEEALRDLCVGHRCLKDLRDARLLEALRAKLTHEQQRNLDRLAPTHIRLPGARTLPICYETGKPPWASSRLQDFFGMTDGPKVANGVPVVLHLLAPNKRAVQVTCDLAGFWDNHYPELRRQLCRRYPKHAWPEDGRTARPPAPGKLR